jgi:hypothetical protein
VHGMAGVQGCKNGGRLSLESTRRIGKLCRAGVKVWCPQALQRVMGSRKWGLEGLDALKQGQRAGIGF